MRPLGASAVIEHTKSKRYPGIYEISDAARIVHVTSRFPHNSHPVNNRHIIRWIRKGLALPALAEVPGRELLISFEDLISMRVIALLRAVGVSWKKIYVTEAWLREHTGVDRPFASEKLWTAAHEVFLGREGALIAASLGGQYPFPELVEMYLVPVGGLTFGKYGLADSWTPHDHIVLRPNVQFGAPCIRGTRIPTRTLWGMYEGGDSVDFIASVYGLEPGQVREAIQWENRLAAAA